MWSQLNHNSFAKLIEYKHQTVS